MEFLLLCYLHPALFFLQKENKQPGETANPGSPQSPSYANIIPAYPSHCVKSLQTTKTTNSLPCCNQSRAISIGRRPIAQLQVSLEELGVISEKFILSILGQCQNGRGICLTYMSLTQVRFPATP